MQGTASGRAHLALAGAALAAALAPHAAPAQAPGPVTVEVGGYYQALDRGYGDWRGLQARVLAPGRRASPFGTVVSQTRDGGTQWSAGGGSYLALGRGATLVVGASAAPRAALVLFPALRLDGMLLLPVRGAPGLLATLGATEFRYPGGAGGTLLAAGPTLYRGGTIYGALGRLAHDRVGGAWAGSALATVQHGRQGRGWLGGELGYGFQAYAVPGTTPVDARFRSVTAALHAQAWLRRRSGLLARYDFEDKRGAYRRNGLALSWFVEP